jgi:glycosyltransferase involved in cell wall biosynthesis
MIAPSSPNQTFTVFTPTYDRAHTLHRVYRSLFAQTFRDFEWLIVDDGSTDDTAAVVKLWQQEATFPIRYFYQQNQGKHVAFNRGVRNARGHLFLPLDSDDECTRDALERFLLNWHAIPNAQQSAFCGVTCLCVDQTGKLLGNEFPQRIMDSDSLEVAHRFKVRGEKWGFTRTEILREYPFPEPPGVKFLPEGIVWSQIARRYRTRFVNERLRVYWLDPQGRLSTVSNPAKHAAGLGTWHRSILNCELEWFFHAPMTFCKSAVHYLRFSMHQRIPLLKQFACIRPLARALCAVALPFAYLQYLFDRRR